MTAFNVDYLLSISRFTERYFGELHELVGRNAHYMNPGTSLRSFIVSKHLRDEIVQIRDPEVLLLVQECEAFTSSRDMIERAVQLSLHEATMITAQVDVLQDRVKIQYISDVIELGNLSLKLRQALETLRQSEVPYNLETPDGKNFKHSLFELQDHVEELSHRLSLTLERPIILPTGPGF